MRSSFAAGAVATGATWDEALEGVLAQTGESIQGADLLLVFASYQFAPDYGALLARLREVTACRMIAGCSGGGIIGGGQEIEDQPAVAVLGVTMPGARVQAAHVTQAQIADVEDADGWLRLLRVEPHDVNAWIVLADPFRLDTDRLVAGLTAAYPGLPIMGGMASGHPRMRGSHVFFGMRAIPEGATLIALGGSYTIRPVVAQGAEPIGVPWTITGVEGNWVQSIGGRPALEVLTETFRELPPAMQERAASNLLAGLAVNEYQSDFDRGDFLIRNLLGANRETGALAIGDQPRVGQTIQFQVRDARAADEDLRLQLRAARHDLDGVRPVAALLCACNGRGQGLFGAPDHDAAAVTEEMAALPLAGFFCNGEIGPVGGKPFIHGFTASIGLFVPTGTAGGG